MTIIITFLKQYKRLRKGLHAVKPIKLNQAFRIKKCFVLIYNISALLVLGEKSK